MRAQAAGLLLAVAALTPAEAQPMSGWPFDSAPPPVAAPAQRALRIDTSPPARGRVRPYAAEAEVGLALGVTRRARVEVGYRFAPPETSAPAGPVGESGRGTFLGLRRSLGP